MRNKTALLKAFNQTFGSREDVSGTEIFVSAKINRKFACYKSGRYYYQTGNILFDLIGKLKDGRDVFTVNVDYDIDSFCSGRPKYVVCDKKRDITNKINNKIIPLAVKYAGQNIIIEK